MIENVASKMRKDKIYVFGSLALFLWICMTYFLFVHRPNPAESLRKKFLTNDKDLISESLVNLHLKIEDFERRLKRTSEENSELLQSLQKAVSSKSQDNENRQKSLENEHKNEDLVIAVLMFACNRVTVSKALDSLLKIRTNKSKFPIIVSQDCGHAETAQVIQSYGDQIQFIQQPDQGKIAGIPKKERKFEGYFKIARHYGWALNEMFKKYQQVIIVEDDLEVSPDFFDYFESTLPVLKADPSLWCVSAWNDNGKSGLIDQSAHQLLYRTDFFGGLGWMLTKTLWDEIGPKWPRSYWDDWMRHPDQRKGRACIRPEISRTKTFGKIGVSNGLFFDKHLKFIQLNEIPAKWGDLTSTLHKTTYDKELVEKLNSTPVVTLQDLKNGGAGSKPVRVVYSSKESFKRIARALGFMDDFKSGVPRMAYQGVVFTMYKGQRVYVVPNSSWKGYDPTW